MGLLSFAGLNGAIVLSAVMVMQALQGRSGSSDASLLHYAFGVCVLYHAMIVLIEVVLGCLGLLSLAYVSLATYGTCAALFFLRRSPLVPSFARPRFSLKAAALPALLYGPMAVLLFIRLCNALVQIPLEFDAHVYHLPIATEWLQTHSIIRVHYSAFAGPLGFYPSMHELVFLWYMLPFHSDLLLNLVNFPLFIALVCLIYAILRELRVSRGSALIAAAFPLYLPVFTQQLGTIFVDTFFTVHFLFAVFFLLQVHRGKETVRSSLLLGLSAGIFMGTKYLGLAYCLPLLAATIGVGVLRRTRTRTRGILLAMAVWAAVGSFFYLRNWWNAGNPVFPVEVVLGARRVFEGYRDMDAVLAGTSIIRHAFDPRAWRPLLGAWTTMWSYAGWMLLIVPAFAVAFTGKEGKRTPAALLLVAGVVAYAALYVLAPYGWRDLIHNVRYAMPMLALACVAFGYTYDVLATATLRALLFGLAVMAFAQSLAELLLHPAYKMQLDFVSVVRLPAFCALVLLAVVSLASLPWWRTKAARIVAAASGLVCAVGILAASAVLREQWAPHFIGVWFPSVHPYSVIFDAARWLDAHDPAANVAYAGFHFHYPLAGRSLQRRVEYININACRDCRYAEFRNSFDSIRSNPDYGSWLQNLKAKEKRHVVVHTSLTPGVRMFEEEWAMAHPESFRLEYRTGDLSIFRVL